MAHRARAALTGRWRNVGAPEIKSGVPPRRGSTHGPPPYAWMADSDERIWIEIDGLGRSLAGALHKGTAVRRFTGWLELVALLEETCATAVDETAPRPTGELP